MKRVRILVGLIGAIVVLTAGGTAFAQAAVDANRDGIFCYKFTGGANVVIKDNRSGTPTGCPSGFSPFDTEEQRDYNCVGGPWGMEQCEALRDLCLSAGWIYEDAYIAGSWIGGSCTNPNTPQPG
jgi:hypothetical protein